MNGKVEKETNMGKDDVFNFGNIKLKVSVTSCHDIWEKVGCTGFKT